jgi:hypothetical protein
MEAEPLTGHSRGADEAGGGRLHRRLWRWLLAIPVVGLLVLGLALAFFDEPLRAYAERQLNGRVQGYTFSIGKLDLHPSGSLDLEDARHDHLVQG